MQLLKSNPDGNGQTIEEVPPHGSVAEDIEYGRAASEGGFITLLGQFEQTLEGGGGEPKPGDPPPLAWIPQILAVFNNGSQIVCYIT
jgi:hypothetical protein